MSSIKTVGRINEYKLLPINNAIYVSELVKKK